jgi:hypothetical protein
MQSSAAALFEEKYEERNRHAHATGGQPASRREFRNEVANYAVRAAVLLTVPQIPPMLPGR